MVTARSRRLMWCMVVFGALAGTGLAALPTAHADAKFIAGSTAWVGPAGSAGVIHQGSQIWVDVNGDALENAGDTHHPVPSGITTDWSLRLSPTRTIMTATLGSGGSCTPETTLVRVFSIPGVDAQPMAELGSQQTLYQCLNPTLFFDPSPGAGFRTAVFLEVGSAGNNPSYLWWDLVTGVAAKSAFPFLPSTGFVEFAPSGKMALVQHDVNGPGGTNYSLASLCPAHLGQASQPGYEYSGELHAWVAGTPSTVQFRAQSDGSIHGGGTYDSCSAVVPIGGCCKPDGTCSDTPQADCVGDWHADKLCAALSCPTAVLAVSMTGPASAERGAQVTYTLTARNDGAIAAGSVAVIDRIPTGSTFVSATAGGTFSAVTSNVTWTVGTLSGGQQSVLTVTVLSPCFGSSMTNLTYSISGTPGGAVAGSPFVSTLLTAPNTSGLTLTLLSSALDPTPLQTGGRTRHTIRMANTLATARKGISFSVNAGASSRMLQVVNAGGGAATLTSSSLSWAGDLPATSTTDVIYDTEVIECRIAQPGVEIINRGNTVFLRNACSVTLVSQLPTQSIPVAPSPFALDLQSPSHGPVQSWGAANDNRSIACRPGDAVDADLMISNTSGAPSPSSNVSLTLPTELSPVGNPPFLASPPAGTSWDAGLRKISWSGQVPANDTLVISFRVQMSASACSGDLSASGGFSNCFNFLSSDLRILSVPVPPPTLLLALHSYDGLWYQEPLVPQTWNGLLCGTFETLRGFGMTPDSTFWVAGVPCFRLNPWHLNFEVFQPSFLTALGMDWVYDAAGDPRDSSVVFAGYQTGSGLRLRRYNPRTKQVSVILNDTNPQTLGIARSVTVSSDGILGVNTNNGVLRVDPANPGAWQMFTPPGGGQVSGLTLDDTGNWLTSGRPGGPGTPRMLENVDRQSGAYSSIVDLQSHFTWFVDMPAVANSPNRDVYLSSGDAVFGKVQRAMGNAVTTSTVPVTITDLAWIGPAVTAAETPGVEGTPGALALSAPWPNPARAEVRLDFVLPVAGRATLAVYDVGGRRVRALVSGMREAGPHRVTWDGTSDAGSRLGAGLYFVKLTTREGERIAKLVLAH